jgi:hypothetical protein
MEIMDNLQEDLELMELDQRVLNNNNLHLVLNQEKVI